MTIIETGLLSGMGLEPTAVLTNFQTAYRLAELRSYIFPYQIRGENMKAPLPGLAWKLARAREDIRLLRLSAKRGLAASAIDCGKSGLIFIDPDAKDGKRGIEACDIRALIEKGVA
jgi:hypothetical protein